MKQLQTVTHNTMNGLFQDALQAEIFLARGKSEPALKLYLKALGSGKLYADYFVNGLLFVEAPLRDGLVRCYLKMGNEAKAAEAFEALINSGLGRVNHPILYVKTLAQLATLKQKAGDQERAGELLQMFLKHWGKADWDLPEIRNAHSQLNQIS